MATALVPGVEIGQRLELRNPAAVEEPAVHGLALLVQQLDADLLAQLGSEELGEPLSRTWAALAHCSNESSWVTPRSRVIGSYFVRPSPLRMIALPPSLYSITSEERLIALTLLTPATGEVLVSK